MSSATLNAPGTVVEKLTEEKFPIKNRSIHMSLELRENQLLAALLDKHTNTYMAWASYPINEKEANLNSILDDELVNQPALNTSIVFTANSALLVPALYFKKETVKDYLDTQQLNKADQTPCYDYVKNLDSYNLYTVDKSLHLLSKKYPNAVFRHHSSIFLEYILIENKNAKEDKVHVSIFSNYIDVAVLQAGKLILSNRYYFENSSDFIYNLLWVYEQMALDAQKVACVFYGEIEKSSEIFKLSSRYIKNVTLGQRNEQSSYSIPLNSLSAHKYRSLFTQYLCI
jgi:hypothetical protein